MAARTRSLPRRARRPRCHPPRRHRTAARSGPPLQTGPRSLRGKSFESTRALSTEGTVHRRHLPVLTERKRHYGTRQAPWPRDQHRGKKVHPVTARVHPGRARLDGAPHQGRLLHCGGWLPPAGRAHHPERVLYHRGRPRHRGEAPPSDIGGSQRRSDLCLHGALQSENVTSRPLPDVAPWAAVLPRRGTFLERGVPAKHARGAPCDAVDLEADTHAAPVGGMCEGDHLPGEAGLPTAA